MINTTTTNLINLAVIVGLAVVAPLALGGWWRWALAAGLAAGALKLSPGVVAGSMASGAAVIAAMAELHEISGAQRVGQWQSGANVRVVAGAWGFVATAALVVSRLGATPLGIHEPFVELTAVHFLFAGVGALMLAGAAGSTAAVVVTAAAPPIVALGFVTGWAAPQVGGAVLLAVGVFAIAVLELRAAVTERGSPWYRRALLATSGLAVWAPMVFAVAWASGQHWAVPALSVPDMVRWHGLPNALGFVIAGLIAARIPTRQEATV